MEMKPGYKQTEVGAIPEEWDVFTVRQKGEVVTGKALAVNAPGIPRPYLRTKNVFDGRIDIDDVLTMPMTDEQFAQFQIRNGDVLLNEGQSLELVGRCAIYQDEYPEPCAMQNALLRFRARTGVSSKFASYLFRHCQQTGVFARIALQTTSIAHLGGSRFEQLSLAWPTEAEQCSIATALSDVDALIGGLDKLIAKKRDIKQAAMQQLLTGQTRLPGFHGEWEVKTLQDVFLISTGRSKSTYVVPDGDFWVVDMGSVSPSGQLIVSKQTNFDDDFLKVGDLVMPKDDIGGGNIIGKVGYIDADKNYVLGDHVYCLSAKQGDPQFLAYMINSHTINRALRKKVIGSAQLGLGRRSVYEQEITFPLLIEQTAIAAVLTDMDAELELLEQRLTKIHVVKQGMMQELLTGRIRLLSTADAGL